jgi:LysR substrate binding domain
MQARVWGRSESGSGLLIQFLRDLEDLFRLRDPLTVAVGEKHRLADARTIAPGGLRDERVLVLRDGHCSRGDMLAVCRGARVDPGAAFETDQFESIFALVASGFGVSVVPEIAAGAAKGCPLIPLSPARARRIGYARARRVRAAGADGLHRLAEEAAEAAADPQRRSCGADTAARVTGRLMCVDSCSADLSGPLVRPAGLKACTTEEALRGSVPGPT